DQAAALGALLGSVKAGVMETKVDGDSITVTTTPDVQAAIAQIVRLVQGQGGGQNLRFEYKMVPATPAKPAVPATPESPKKPAAINVPGVIELDKDGIRQRIEVELKRLDNVKDLEKLKNLNIDLKALDTLKDLKIDVKPLEHLKAVELDLSKLKEMDNLKELEKPKQLKEADALKSLEKRRGELDRSRDVEGQREQLEKRQQELEKAIKALIEGTKKPGSEKPPEGPAK
ncbi:MAG: hypothetical protein J2P46_10780, partial [Zavarzinella sp.]|nr:hypothetical protein [Zavarzinella sp.]